MPTRPQVYLRLFFFGGGGHLKKLKNLEKLKKNGQNLEKMEKIFKELVKILFGGGGGAPCPPPKSTPADTISN